MTLEDLVLLVARCIAWPGALIDGLLPEDRSTRVLAYLMATWIGWVVTLAVAQEVLYRLAAAADLRGSFRGSANSHRAAERRVRILFSVWRYAITAAQLVWVMGHSRFWLGYAPEEEKCSLEEVSRPVPSRRRAVTAMWWLVDLVRGIALFLVRLVLMPRFILITAAALWLALRTPGVGMIGRVSTWGQGVLDQVTLAQLITVGGALALVTSFFWSAKFRGRIAWRRDGYREAYSKLEEAGFLARAAAESLYRIRTTVDGEILHDIARIVRKSTGGRFTAYHGAVKRNTFDHFLPLTPRGQARKERDPATLIADLSESPVESIWEYNRVPRRTVSRPTSEVPRFVEEVDQLAKLFSDWDSPGTHQLVKLASPATRQVVRERMHLHPVFRDTAAWKKSRKESLERNVVVVARGLLANPPPASEPNQPPDWAAATAEVRDVIQEEVDEWIAEYRDAYSGALWRAHALEWAAQELLKPRQPRGIRALAEHISGRSA
ncbi:MAG: hypothetical protein ACTH2Q_00480 [Propionibacteriaceae bacterium]